MRILIFILCMSSHWADARTIFEPSLGLTYGDFQGRLNGSENSTLAANEVQATYTSLNLGFRYGITRRYVHVTAIGEAYLTNVSGVNEPTASVNSSTESQFNFGVGIGYEWNIPLRTYVIIGFPYSGLELSYYISDGFLLGLKYNRLEIGFADVDVNVNTFGLAVSFPIEFDYPSNWFRKRDWQ